MSGTLLSWEEIQEHSRYVKDQGVRQFLRLFHEVKDRPSASFKWGDEVEYMLIRLDHADRKAYLTLNNERVISAVRRGDVGTQGTRNRGENGSIWTLEMAPYMVESSPGEPFGGEASDYVSVEENLRCRREQINRVLTGAHGTEDVCLPLCSFPRNGIKESIIPFTHPTSSTSARDTIEEQLKEYFANHPRYRGIAENCMKRSGNHSRGYVPVFEDEFTDMANISSPVTWASEMHVAAKRGHIPIVSTTLSGGFSALQLTIQGTDLQEARILHDQLVPLCPIMMALSVASPIFHGYLTDWDSRWNIMSQGSDCRTSAERGEEPLRGESYIIPKSRCGSVNGYISISNASSNDVHFPFDEKLYQQLTEGAIDTCLAKHMARQFLQDPVFLLEDHLHQSESSTGHLENILRTNWQSVRLKIPTAGSDDGWKVEFRPMSAQLTDFENAAYLIFMVLLTRATLSLGLDFVMPISKVDANMDKAPLRDALRQQKFFFRANPYADAEEGILCEMDVDTIINGGNTAEGVNFPGLIPLVNEYLATLPEESNGFKLIVERYLDLISQKAAGHVKTNAQWIRDFVLEHPDYQRDSVVTERINYDLMSLFRDISHGKVAAQHLSTT